MNLEQLRQALAVLALPPQEQIRVNGPGCVACDLFWDFRAASEAALHSDANLSDVQRATLTRIADAFDSLSDADCECFDNAVLERPGWNEIRGLALSALSAFGWQKTDVPAFTEVKPGMWFRPTTGASEPTK